MRGIKPDMIREYHTVHVDCSEVTADRTITYVVDDITEHEITRKLCHACGSEAVPTGFEKEEMRDFLLDKEIKTGIKKSLNILKDNNMDSTDILSAIRDDVEAKLKKAGLYDYATGPGIAGECRLDNEADACRDYVNEAETWDEVLDMVITNIQGEKESEEDKSLLDTLCESLAEHIPKPNEVKN